MDTGTWVPLVTAAAGLAAGLATGLATTILARRWSREDRAAAWQREDALRWQADRLQAYTRTIAALDAWEAEAGKAMDRREAGEPFGAAEWERHDLAVLGVIAQLELMAPELVTNRARRCHLVFGQLRLNHLDADHELDFTVMHLARHRINEATWGLLAAMRADLGLGESSPPALMPPAEWEGRPGG
jgi:hypothetical protein